MRVFVAGGSGVLGRRLVPQLVARGHQVTATTTSAAKLGLLEQLGAEAVVMDGLDAASVGEAVAAARPDAIVHQMTALSDDARRQARPQACRPLVRRHQSAAHRGDRTTCWPRPRRPVCRHFVAQSYASWNGLRDGRLGQDRGGPAGR